MKPALTAHAAIERFSPTNPRTSISFYIVLLFFGVLTHQPLLTCANASLSCIRDSNYGDVQQHALLGMPILEGRGVPGTLHIFLKALRLDSLGYKVRGFLFFETSSPPRRRGHKYLAPPGLYESLTLQVTTEGSEAIRVPILQLPSDKKGRREATPQEFFFTVECCNTNTVLSVQQFKRVIHIRSLLQRGEAPAGSSTLKIVKFLPTYFGSFSMESYMELVKASVMYHTSIRFTNSVLYARPWRLTLLKQQAQFQQLCEIGLTIVEWEALASPTDVEIGIYDFLIQMFHISLSFWGVKSRVLLTDLDEFIALPRGRNILDEFHDGGCFSNGDVALVPVHNVRPEDLSLVNASSDLLFNLTLWNEQKISTGSGVGAPIWALTLRAKRAIAPKVFLQPNRQMMGYMHSAYCCPEFRDTEFSPLTVATAVDLGRIKSSWKRIGGELVYNQKQDLPCNSKVVLCRRIQQSCAFIAHVSDMYGVRGKNSRSHEWEKDTSWLWSVR